MTPHPIWLTACGVNLASSSIRLDGWVMTSPGGHRVPRSRRKSSIARNETISHVLFFTSMWAHDDPGARCTSHQWPHSIRLTVCGVNIASPSIRLNGWVMTRWGGRGPPESRRKNSMLTVVDCGHPPHRRMVHSIKRYEKTWNPRIWCSLTSYLKPKLFVWYVTRCVCQCVLDSRSTPPVQKKNVFVTFSRGQLNRLRYIF